MRNDPRPSTILHPLHPPPHEPPPYGDRRRVAFVTGAGRGIGLSIALRLAKDGLDVAVNDINAEAVAETVKEIQELGAKSVAVIGDISNEESVKSMIDKVVAELGYLDVMVANAGIVITKPFVETTGSDIDRLFGINVRGTYLCYSYAAKHFIKQGTGGKLIAASSLGGFRQLPLLSAYCGTKFAIRGINQAAAAEFAPHGITANCYAPGLVETDMRDAIDKGVNEHTGMTAEESNRAALSIIPLGRGAQADDVSNVVSFLASRNSDYMTGQALLMDGGAFMP